ncbi:MAG: hypothetical protein IPJ13_07345 [Saprospiraceae bacterium]|nr:hypothetical protein [Saprospiraceae bacterium]
MMKTKFTKSIQTFRWLILMVLTFSAINDSFSQTIADCKCGSPIHISLNSQGWAKVTPLEVLASPTSCSDAAAGTVVIMTSATGGIISRRDTVDCSHIGKTLYAKYTNAAGTNSCWTLVAEVKDALAPTIVCPADMTISCAAMPTWTPTISDNCAGVKSVQVGADIINAPCTPTSDTLRTITRTYIAEDAAGNRSAPCTIRFHVKTIANLVTGISMPAIT